MGELVRGFTVQLRVVFALALRETRTRFGGYKAGYVWALLEPVFWIGTFAAVFSLAGRTGNAGTDVIAFLATGIIPFELATKTADRASNAISGNKALLFYPQVQPLDLVISRVGLEVATYFVVFVVILGTRALYLQTLEIDDLLTTIAGLLLAGAFGGSLGLVFCTVQTVFPTIERIRGPLMRPLFWISGLFFSVDTLPTAFRDLLLWNPILHCVEMVRAGWFRALHADHVSVSYVLTWIIALSFVGLTVERATRHRVELS